MYRIGNVTIQLRFKIIMHVVISFGCAEIVQIVQHTQHVYLMEVEETQGQVQQPKSSNKQLYRVMQALVHIMNYISLRVEQLLLRIA